MQENGEREKLKVEALKVEQMPFELFMPVYDKLLNFSTSKLKLSAKIVQGESRAKRKAEGFAFSMPSRSLSSTKIVQGESRAKRKRRAR